MTFEELVHFLTHDMQMSHLYQPVVIRTLIDHGGEVALRHIASEVLAYDEAQVDYYCRKLNLWPKRTLAKHGVIDAGRAGYFRLTLDPAALTRRQRNELLRICDDRIREYIGRYAGLVGDRRYNAGPLSSESLRYLALKLARGRCALCGASVKDTPIEIDHIVPRAKGGTNDLSNLQALCSRCNRGKRDRDHGDFRGLGVKERPGECPFCHLESRVVHEYNTAQSIRDGFPVTALHTLLVPKRHVTRLWDLSLEEIGDLFQLAKVVAAELQAVDRTITGFNVGLNDGVEAGQTVPHAHVHLIPRRKGDVSDPRGGIRAIIPGSSVP